MLNRDPIREQEGQVSYQLALYGTTVTTQPSFSLVACEVQDLFVTCRSSALSGALHAVQPAEARKRRFSTANKTPLLLI